MNIIIIVTVIVILILSAAAAAAARSAGFSQCVRTELLLIAKSSPRKNPSHQQPAAQDASSRMRSMLSAKMLPQNQRKKARKNAKRWQPRVIILPLILLLLLLLDKTISPPQARYL